MDEAPVEIVRSGWAAGIGHVDGRLSVLWLRHHEVDRLGGEGCPLIGPWFGRLDRHGYEVSGAQVVLDPADPRLDHDEQGRPLHGLRTDPSQWTLAEVAPGSVAATTTAFVGSQFPFPHELGVLLELSEVGLTITTTLKAGPDRAVPVGFGWHPYLVAGADPVDSWTVELPFTEQLVLEDLLPAGASRRVAPSEEPLRPRDDCFVAGTGLVARVTGPSTRATLTLDHGYGWSMVWAPAGASFVCIEPMAGPLLALREGSGAPVVPPGGCYSAGFTLS